MNNFTIILSMCLFFGVAFAQDTTTVLKLEPAEVVETAEDTTAVSKLEPAEIVETAEVTQPVEQCASKYNINEVLYNVKQSFLSGFKVCATDLVKKTKPAPKQKSLTMQIVKGAKSQLTKKSIPEQKSFMTQCVMDNINKKLEGVPSADKITNTVDNFLDILLNAKLSGGDPKVLVKAADNLDISGMMEIINNFGANNACFVNMPYEQNDNEEDDSKKKVNVDGVISGLRAIDYARAIIVGVIALVVAINYLDYLNNLNK